MKRQNPLFTQFGVVLTVLFLAGIGLSIWSSGGIAFSPGRLTAKRRAATTRQGYESHADFENQCSLCHAPLEVTQDELCLACHQNINQQVMNGSGTHSLIEDVSLCARCHPDHRGLEFDPAASALHLFDHTRTAFSLVRHQVDYRASPLLCQTCHMTGFNTSVSNSPCGNCHALEDRDFVLNHILKFNPDCLTCHDGVDRMTLLDHQLTSFPLDGKHSEVNCIECHQLEAAAAEHGSISSRQQIVFLAESQLGSAEQVFDPFKNTPTECDQCHNEPEVHLGVFAGECSDCHTSQGWEQASLNGKRFNHTADIGFDLAHHLLDYEHQPMDCNDCHQGELEKLDQQSCIACHASDGERAAFLQAHREQFGDNCLECHDGVDRMREFDHGRYFPLTGSHAVLECTHCHQDNKYIGTPSECVQCHAEPALHAGFFGMRCQYCHTDQAWSPAKLIIHLFPLDHGSQGEVACQVCHPQDYVVYTCYGCHDHQPDPIAASHQEAGIALESLGDCAECHPSGKIEAQE